MCYSNTFALGVKMKRREFISLIGGAVAAWPLAVRAQQQPNRVRRIGVLMNTNTEQGQAWHAAFVQGLQQLGWEIRNNAQIDTRWGAGDTELFRKYAAELVASKPQVYARLGGAGKPGVRGAPSSRSVKLIYKEAAN
jgi:putative tryptophan/tyrosine transport system substrate-binding protein